MAKTLIRNPRLEARDVDTDLFLIDETGGAIHHLNATAAALWRLLEVPASRKNLVAQFRHLYPDEDAQLVENAIRSLIRDLVSRKIVTKSKRARHT